MTLRPQAHEETENYINTLLDALRDAISYMEMHTVETCPDSPNDNMRALAYIFKAFDEIREGGPNRLRERMNRCLAHIRTCENGFIRYELLRTLNPAQFSALWEESLAFDTPFDKCVDRRIQLWINKEPMPYKPLPPVKCAAGGAPCQGCVKHV